MNPPYHTPYFPCAHWVFKIITNKVNFVNSNPSLMQGIFKSSIVVIKDTKLLLVDHVSSTKMSAVPNPFCQMIGGFLPEIAWHVPPMPGNCLKIVL